MEGFRQYSISLLLFFNRSITKTIWWTLNSLTKRISSIQCLPKSTIQWISSLGGILYSGGTTMHIVVSMRRSGLVDLKRESIVFSRYFVIFYFLPFGRGVHLAILLFVFGAAILARISRLIEIFFPSHAKKTSYLWPCTGQYFFFKKSVYSLMLHYFMTCQTELEIQT